MKHHVLATFFKDSRDTVTIWQFPNKLLIAWATLRTVVMFMPKSTLSNNIALLSSCVLFTWAYLEITQGASHFRRALGCVVMLVVIFGILGMKS